MEITCHKCFCFIIHLLCIFWLWEEKGVSGSALAVAWMCNVHRMKGFPRVIPLFSSSKLSHFVDNCSGADIVLTDEEMAILTNA